ncbi:MULTISPECIES: autotransporter outer membrane beta-barrel domain-containing protein [Fusobacterium]|uniref:autotransporter outer membrane beta-barrel domain-containing protein n=1 Tax=Fusobacterium TaxID=848 RepID=UPI0014773245|nr:MULTISPECIES: autotransporter outer membrane beta-barrel domain-containing protein [Fusobacterium]NME35677.1 autotransporter outer membrane beta-barrel domain-containing protein [Fusobacterium sp. FSA-380-WT-3A]
MKDNIEKSLKRWLKKKVKITLALITTFLITGSIGYGEEIGPLWGSNINKTVEGDLIVSTKPEGTKIGIGFNGNIDVSGNLTVNAASNGIQSSDAINPVVKVFANEITINSGDNGIFTSWGDDRTCKGNVEIGSEDRKVGSLTITSGGQGIDNKKGKTEIYVSGKIDIHSKGTSGYYTNQAAINNNGDKKYGEVIINGEELNLTAEKGNGIINGLNEAGSFITKAQEIESNTTLSLKNSLDINASKNGIENIYGTLNIKVKGEAEKSGIINIEAMDGSGIINGCFSKKGFFGGDSTDTSGITTIIVSSLSINSSTNGIQNNIGEVDITSENSVVINTLENGIMNEKDGTTNIKTTSLLIGETDEEGNIIAKSKNGIYSKGVVDVKNNENSIGKDFYIAATEKSLYTDNGAINLSTSGNINIYSMSEDNNTFGIYAKGGNTSLTGNTLNIKSTGKQINGKDIKGEAGTNFTVSQLFNVTQGIRLENETKLNLDGIKDVKVTSSDIAVTANNSDFTFNGNSYFEGNDYLISDYEGDNLLVRPIIQAVNGGNISLTGNTTVISNTGHDGIDGDRINNVGIYSEGTNSTSTVTGNLTVISGNDYYSNKNTETEEDVEKNIIKNTDIALMATSGGKIEVIGNGNIKLIGDIISGKGDSVIEISNSENSTEIVGEVLAANGGKVHLDMSNGGYFVGRVDDYFEIEEFKKEEIDFRNDKFTKDIESDGEVTINLGNNATWNVLGQSFITNLNFAEGGGVVDLTHDGNALRIKNLSGEGTFNLTLNADNKSLGNMLYIYDVDNGIEVMSLGENQDNQSKVLTQKVNLTDSILELDYGEKLRFATLSKEAHGKVEFKVNEVKEKGINDVSFETRYEDYNHEAVEENIVYNGEKASNKKPGDKLVSGKKVNTENTLTTLEVALSDEETNTLEEEKFDASQNWYLTRLGEDLNDGGKTVIEMSRANYASAVYMDNLNKRLGDMSFVDGNEGIWTRIRNDRVGEDEEYRLRNNMYQIGYDKTYPMDDGEGNEYRGIALEYTEGTMEYKNIIGEADVDRVALWLYDTNVYNDGFYSDYVFRIGRMSSNFSINGRETGAKVEGDFRNLFLGASAEFGKRYDLTEKTYFEPQVQLQYTYIDDADYTTNQGTKVDYSDIHSLIGRVGFRLGHDFYNDNGKDNTIYLKADVNHEFLGEQDINAVDMTGSLGEEFRNYKNKGTWFDVGIGAAKNMTENLYVYADIERQFGHRDDNSWQFNLGFRYKFSSLKDFSLTNLFDFDKSEIKPEGKEEIAKISKELNKKKYKGTLKLEGHTDWTGTREYNQGLSERRVKAVEEELKKNVTNEKLKYETKGYGEDRPVADNRTKEGRALNRRVEVKYEK